MARPGRVSEGSVARAAGWRCRWALLVVLLLGACAGPGAQATPTPGLDLSPTETPPAPAPSALPSSTATAAPSSTPTRVAMATATARPAGTATATRRPAAQPSGPTPTSIVLSSPSKLTQLGLQDEVVQLVAAGGDEGRTLFAAGKEGLRRSRDGGKTWSVARSSDLVPKATALVVAPSNPRVIYVGVSDGCGTPVKRPGFVSQDGGDSWTAIGNNLLSIAVDPKNPETVYAVDCRGLVRSANAGRTWTVLEHAPVPAESFAIVAIAPGASQHLYLAYGVGTTRMEVARSVDRGVTWQAVTPAITPNLRAGQVLPGAADTTGEARPLALAVDATNPAIVLLSTTQGVFRTEDSGAKWTLAGQGLENTVPAERVPNAGPLTSALVGDPGKTGAFWVGTGAAKMAGVGLFRTRDGGESWRKPVTGLEGRSILALAFGGTPANRTLYIATDEGVWSLSSP